MSEIVVEPKVLCPFCSKPWTKGMLKAYDGSYGCDTGCEYMTITIECSSCGKEVYVKGAFGETSRTDLQEEIENDDLKQAAEDKREY